MKRSEEDLGWRTLNTLRKMKLRWFGHVKRRDENSKVRRALELKVEGRIEGQLVGQRRPGVRQWKKT